MCRTLSAGLKTEALNKTRQTDQEALRNNFLT